MSLEATFKALGDKNRREILTLLKENRKMSAGEISDHFEMTSATMSYHLGLLKKADLIIESREKNYRFYELNTSVVEDVLQFLMKYTD